MSTSQEEESVKHRNDDLLLMIAIGDAYAAATEYVDHQANPGLIMEALELKGYLQHPTHLDLRPGRYTDDAQMSIAVAEVLLQGQPLTSRAFAEAFVRAFKRDPRAGYARGFQAFLESVKDVDDFLNRIRPTSPKNGACMRAVPLGVLPTPDEVFAAAAVQASVTHNTMEGRISSTIVALLSHLALYTNLTFEQMIDRVSWLCKEELDELELDLTEPRRTPVLQPARHTIHAVAHLLCTSSTLSEVLRGTIAIGGDSDSVGAIALGIASTRMPNDLPLELVRDLEPYGAYGTPFLLTLGQNLMERYDRT